MVCLYSLDLLGACYVDHRLASNLEFHLLSASQVLRSKVSWHLINAMLEVEKELEFGIGLEFTPTVTLRL